MVKERNNYRKHLEFPKETKEEARRRAEHQCENCGSSDGRLEVHHILGIWYAINYHPEISSVVIKSLENAICLCPECHQETHNDPFEKEIMDDHAEYLFSIQTLNMFTNLAEEDIDR